MAKVQYDVERVDPRGEDIAGKLKTQIEAGAAQGKQLVNVLSTFDCWLLVWQLPGREQRG